MPWLMAWIVAHQIAITALGIAFGTIVAGEKVVITTIEMEHVIDNERNY